MLATVPESPKTQEGRLKAKRSRVLAAQLKLYTPHKETFSMTENLTLDDYQNGARVTAVYPGKGENLYYPALGLAGEVSEMLEKVVTQAEEGEVLAETGDVLWYVANLSYEAGLLLGEVIPGGQFPQAEKGDAAGAVIAAGRVVEVVKKTYRDNAGELTDEKREKIRTGLAEVLACLAGVAKSAGGTLEEAAKGNLEKLQSRQARGKLTGDGDNR